MHDDFRLVLLVTHDCNMRCVYCYSGAKTASVMDARVGRAAIDRAVASTNAGGRLDLGFFGGEPLLEAELILELLQYSQSVTKRKGVTLSSSMTTNGTITGDAAWQVMCSDGMRVSVSHDGLPEVHDGYRRTLTGKGTSDHVLGTIRALRDAGREVHAVVVVRPGTVDMLADGVAFLLGTGVKYVALTLDLWTTWSQHDDGLALERGIGACATVWREHLPEHGVNWFDDKASSLLGVSRDRDSGSCSEGTDCPALPAEDAQFSGTGRRNPPLHGRPGGAPPESSCRKVTHG